jgi:RNA polymerase sigma-70 factor (ECF subfamily)
MTMLQSLPPLIAAFAAASPPDDRLSRFAAGDLDAFESLFREFQAPVFGWIVKIVRDRAAAEDLTIETFWRIYRARARFDPRRSFAAWARRIATNAAISQLRQATWRRLSSRLDEPATNRLYVDSDLGVREAIVRAFGTLPPRLRVAATLALIEQEPYEDIAAALGISVGTVKSRVFRAVRQLRKKLERMGITP